MAHESIELEFNACDYDTVDFVAEIAGVSKDALALAAKRYNKAQNRRCRRSFGGEKHLHMSFLPWYVEGGGVTLGYPNTRRVDKVPEGFTTAKAAILKSRKKKVSAYAELKEWISGEQLEGVWYRRVLYINEAQYDTLLAQQKVIASARGQRWVEPATAPSGWVSLVALDEELGLGERSVEKYVHYGGFKTRFYLGESKYLYAIKHIREDDAEKVRAHFRPYTLSETDLAVVRTLLENGELCEANIQKLEVLTLAHEGHGVVEIGRRINKPHTTVSRYLKRWRSGGIKALLTGGFLNESELKVVSLLCADGRTPVKVVEHLTMLRKLNSGLSVEAVATSMGRYTQTVSHRWWKWKKGGLNEVYGRYQEKCKEIIETTTYAHVSSFR